MMRTLALLSVLLLAFVGMSGCSSTSPTAPPSQPPPAGPGELFNTPDELTQHVANWHEALKYSVNDEVVVLWTTWKNSTVGWIGSVLIYHIPSMSIVPVDFSGQVDESQASYKNAEGQQRLESVLADEELMSRIRQYSELLVQIENEVESGEEFEERIKSLRFESAVPELR